MQINKYDLELQFVELLPERETLFFNRNWQANLSNIELTQNAAAANIGLVNLGTEASAGNVAAIGVEQGNYN